MKGKTVAPEAPAARPRKSGSTRSTSGSGKPASLKSGVMKTSAARKARSRKPPEPLWKRVADDRTAFLTSQFGPLSSDLMKVGHLSPIWPGGGIHLVAGTTADPSLWVYTTFGLSNPDMPTQYLWRQDEPGKPPLPLEKKLAPTIYADRPGYGYELLVFTREQAEWPVWLMQWAAHAEVANDADLLGGVARYKGMTIEDVDVGLAGRVNLLIALAAPPCPDTLALANGGMRVLVATVITDDEMIWSKTHGRDALLARLMDAGVGQVSSLQRASVINPAPLDLGAVRHVEQAQALAELGLLRKCHLFPLELGGPEIAANVVYLPKQAAMQKMVLDQQICALSREGRITNYSANPEYAGKGIVPARIVVNATGVENYQQVIKV